jgi:hypothetical protein
MTDTPQTAAGRALLAEWGPTDDPEYPQVGTYIDYRAQFLAGILLIETEAATRARSGLDAGLRAAVRAYLDESCPGESSCGRPHCDALRAALAREEADDGR